MELIWCDIDLETIAPYPIWKPETVAWAHTVAWAKVNDLVREHPAEFPADDWRRGWASARARDELTNADRAGLASLYSEPIWATPTQMTNGGHRIAAMRSQGVRWALGICSREDVGDSVDDLCAYLP